MARSSLETYADAVFTGCLSCDQSGEMQSVGVLKAGRGPYEKIDYNFGLIRNRWGDYAGAAVDPTDDRTFWIMHEYAQLNNQWATQIGHIDLALGQAASGASASFAPTAGDGTTSNSAVPGAPTTESSTQGLLVLKDFAGPAMRDDHKPPDPILAVGRRQVVAMVNSDIVIYDKETLESSGPVSQKAFWSAPRLPAGLAEINSPFDGKVLYDEASSRFIAITLDKDIDIPDRADDGRSTLLLAISKTSTPKNENDWFKFAYDARRVIDGSPCWADFPGLGVDRQAVYVTARMVPMRRGIGSTCENSSLLLVLDKAALANGRRPSPKTFQFGETVGDIIRQSSTIQPAHAFSSLGAEFLVEAVAPQKIRIYAIENVSTAPTVKTFDLLLPAGLAFQEPGELPQGGSSVGIDGGTSALLNAVFRNGRIWTAHALSQGLSGEAREARVRWYEIDPGNPADWANGADPRLVQHGDVDPGPEIETAYPQIAVNSLSTVALVMARSSPASSIDAVFTARQERDPEGTMFPVEVLHAGEGTYENVSQDGRNRWGDYAGAAVDPLEDNFWVMHQYATTDSSRWATHIAQFTTLSSASCPLPLRPRGGSSPRREEAPAECTPPPSTDASILDSLPNIDIDLPSPEEIIQFLLGQNPSISDMGGGNNVGAAQAMSQPDQNASGFDIFKIRIFSQPEDFAPFTAQWSFNPGDVPGLAQFEPRGRLTVGARPAWDIRLGFDGSGFFVDADSTVKAELSGEFEASGVAFDVFGVGIGGSVTLTPGLDLSGIDSDDDGKLRVQELTGNFTNVSVNLGTVHADLFGDLILGFLDYVDVDPALPNRAHGGDPFIIRGRATLDVTVPTGTLTPNFQFGNFSAGNPDIDGDGTPDYTSAVLLKNVLEFGESLLSGCGTPEYLRDVLGFANVPVPQPGPECAPAQRAEKPRGKLGTHEPTADETRFQDSFRDRIEAEPIDGDAAALREDLRQLLHDWFEHDPSGSDDPNVGSVESRLDLVQPSAAQSLSDSDHEARLLEAIGDWLNWTGSVQWLGFEYADIVPSDPAESAPGAERVVAGIREAMDRANARCGNATNFADAQRAALDTVLWAETAEFLGLATDANGLTTSAVLRDFCLHVEISGALRDSDDDDAMLAADEEATLDLRAELMVRRPNETPETTDDPLETLTGAPIMVRVEPAGNQQVGIEQGMAGSDGSFTTRVTLGAGDTAVGVVIHASVLLDDGMVAVDLAEKSFELQGAPTIELVARPADQAGATFGAGPILVTPEDIVQLEVRLRRGRGPVENATVYLFCFRPAAADQDCLGQFDADQAQSTTDRQGNASRSYQPPLGNNVDSIRAMYFDSGEFFRSNLIEVRTASDPIEAFVEDGRVDLGLSSVSPSAEEEDTRQAISEALGDAVNGQISPQDRDRLVGLLRTWFRDSLVASLNESTQNDNNLLVGLRDLNNWLGDVTSLDLQPSDIVPHAESGITQTYNDAAELAAAGLQAAVSRAVNCSAGVTSLMPLIRAVRWTRAAELLGLAGDSNQLTTAAVLERSQDSCIRVEILQAELRGPDADPLHAGPDGSATLQVQARVLVRQAGGDFAAPGFSVPLTVHLDPLGFNTVDEADQTLNVAETLTTMVRLGPGDAELGVRVGVGFPGLALASQEVALPARPTSDLTAQFAADSADAPEPAGQFAVQEGANESGALPVRIDIRAGLARDGSDAVQDGPLVVPAGQLVRLEVILTQGSTPLAGKPVVFRFIPGHSAVGEDEDGPRGGEIINNLDQRTDSRGHAFVFYVAPRNLTATDLIVARYSDAHQFFADAIMIRYADSGLLADDSVPLSDGELAALAIALPATRDCAERQAKLQICDTTDAAIAAQTAWFDTTVRPELEAARNELELAKTDGSKLAAALTKADFALREYFRWQGSNETLGVDDDTGEPDVPGDGIADRIQFAQELGAQVQKNMIDALVNKALRDHDGDAAFEAFQRASSLEKTRLFDESKKENNPYNFLNVLARTKFQLTGNLVLEPPGAQGAFSQRFLPAGTEAVVRFVPGATVDGQPATLNQRLKVSFAAISGAVEPAVDDTFAGDTVFAFASYADGAALQVGAALSLGVINAVFFATLPGTIDVGLGAKAAIGDEPQTQLTVPPGQSAFVEAVVRQGHGAPPGGFVRFYLSGPGTLSEPAAKSNESGRASVLFTAPESGCYRSEITAKFLDQTSQKAELSYSGCVAAAQATFSAPGAAAESGDEATASTDTPEASGLLNSSGVLGAFNKHEVPLSTDDEARPPDDEAQPSRQLGNALGIGAARNEADRGNADQLVAAGRGIASFFANHLEVLDIVDFRTIVDWFNFGLPATPDELIRLKLTLDEPLPSGPVNAFGADFSELLPDNWIGSVSLDAPRLGGQIVFGIDTSASPFYVVTQSDDPALPASTKLSATFGLNAALTVRSDGDVNPCDPLLANIGICDLEASGRLDTTVIVDLSQVADGPEFGGKLRFDQLAELAKTRVSFDGDPLANFEAIIAGNVTLPLIKASDALDAANAHLAMTGAVSKASDGGPIQFELRTGGTEPLSQAYRDCFKTGFGDTTASMLAAGVRCRLDASMAGNPTRDDPLEDNDSPAAVKARPVSTSNPPNSPNFGPLTEPRVIGNLTLQDAADWFRFETASVGNAQSFVQIDFADTRGDLDLALFQMDSTPAGPQLRRVRGDSLSFGERARVSLLGQPAGEYFVQVFADGGTGRNPSYVLTIAPPGDLRAGLDRGVIGGFELQDVGFALDVNSTGTFNGELFGRLLLPFSIREGGDQTEIAVQGSISNNGFSLHAKTGVGGAAISLLNRDPATLPANLAFDATMNVERSGLFLFDYVYVESGPVRQFKFAGIDAQNGAFVIGHHDDATGWHIDASEQQASLAGQDRKLRLIIQGTSVSLQMEGAGAGGTRAYVTKLEHTFSSRTQGHQGHLGLAVRSGAAQFDDVRVAQLGGSPSAPLLLDGFAAGAANWNTETGLWTVADGRYRGSTERLRFGDVLLVDSATLAADLDVTFDRDPGNAIQFEPEAEAGISLTGVNALLFAVQTGGRPLYPNDPASPRGLVVVNDMTAELSPSGFTASAGRFSAGLQDIVSLDLYDVTLDLTAGPGADLFTVGRVEIFVPSLAIDDDIPLATLRPDPPDPNDEPAAVLGITKPTTGDSIPKLHLKQAGTPVDFDLGNVEDVLGIGGILPFDVRGLSLVFNDPADLSNFDIEANIQANLDPLDGLPFDPIVVVGAALSDQEIGDGPAKRCAPGNVITIERVGPTDSDSDTRADQRFCNGAIEVDLHLPSLLGTDSGFPFANIGPFHIGFQNWNIGDDVLPAFADGLISVGSFHDGVFDGTVAGRGQIRNSETITNETSFIAVSLTGTSTTSRRTVTGGSDGLRARFTSIGEHCQERSFEPSCRDGEIATVTTLDLTGFAEGQVADADSDAFFGAGVNFRLVAANAALLDDPANLDLFNMVFEPSVQEISSVFRVPLGDYLTLSGCGSINLSADPDEPAIEFGSVAVEFGVELGDLQGIVIEAGGFGLGTDGSLFLLPPLAPGEDRLAATRLLDGTIQCGPDGVGDGFHFRLAAGEEHPDGNLFGLPEWMPIVINAIGLKFHGDGVSTTGKILEPQKILDPANFSLLISGGINDDSSLPFTGSFQDLEVDLGRLRPYLDDRTQPFPIVDISGVTIGIRPFEFPPESGFEVGGTLGFGQLPGTDIIYGRLAGEFSIGGVGAGIDLIISQAGPILAKVKAPLGIPLDPAGVIILKDVTGGFAFAETSRPDLDIDCGNPAECSEAAKGLLRNFDDLQVLEITDSQIQRSLQAVFDDPAIDSTWQLPFSMGLRGNLTTLISAAAPGILDGALKGFVSLGAVIDVPTAAGEEFSFKVVGAGQVTVFGLPIGQAGLVLDLDKPLEPQLTFAFAAPPPGSPLGFLFPATGEFTLHLDTAGLYSAPLVGMVKFIESVTQDLTQDPQSPVEKLFRRIAQNLQANHGRKLAQLLLDTDNNGAVSDTEDARLIDAAFLKARLITGSAGDDPFESLLPTSFDDINALLDANPAERDQALARLERAGRTVGALTAEILATAGEAIGPNLPTFAESIADLVGTLARFAGQGIEEAGLAAFDAFNPSLQISGLIQPTVLGFPMGPPLIESTISFAKDPATNNFRLHFDVATSLKETLRAQIGLLTGGPGGVLLSGGLTGLLPELIGPGFTDELNFGFGLEVPTGVFGVMLTGEPPEGFDNVSEYLVDAFNPFHRWEVTIGGKLFFLGFELAQVDGILFGPQDRDDDGQIDDSLGLFASRVVNMDRNQNDEIEDVEKDFPAGAPENGIPVFRQRQYDDMIEHGGILLTAQFSLPRVLIDPFAVLSAIGEPPKPPGINFNLPLETLASLAEFVTAYTSSDRTNQVTREPCSLDDSNEADDEDCKIIGFIPRAIDELTSDELFGSMQLYLPSPATLISLDYLSAPAGGETFSLTDSVAVAVEKFGELFDAVFFEGFLDAKLLGIELGNATVSATSAGFRVEAATPILAGLETIFEIGRREVNAGELIGNLLANPILASVATSLPLPIDEFAELLQIVAGDLNIPYPVASFEATAGLANVARWLTDNFGLPQTVLDSVLGPSDSPDAVRAGVTFAAYTPGFDLDAPHPSADFLPEPLKPFDDIKRYGGFRLDANLNLPGFVDDARFFLEAELIPSSLSGFVLPDFVALAKIDRLNLPGWGIPNRKVLDLDLFAKIAKEGDCAELELDGGLTLFDSLDLDADGKFLLGLGGTCGDASRAAGLYGALDLRLRGARRSQQPKFGDDAFSLTGNFLLQVNTTEMPQTVPVGDRFGTGELELPAGPFGQIHVDGSLDVLGFHVGDGSFDLQTATDRLLIGANGNLDLGPLGSLEAEGGFALFRLNGQGQIAGSLDIATDELPFTLGFVTGQISGTFSFAANTADVPVSIPSRSEPIPAGARLHIGGLSNQDNPFTPARDESKALISLFDTNPSAREFDGLLNLEGLLDISVDGTGFEVVGSVGIVVRKPQIDDPIVRLFPAPLPDPIFTGTVSGALSIRNHRIDQATFHGEISVLGFDLFILDGELDPFGCLRTNVPLFTEIPFRVGACDQHVFFDDVTIEVDAEGNDGDEVRVTVAVRLSEPVEQGRNLLVGFNLTDASADANDDFKVRSISPLIFGEGRRRATISVDVLGDTVPEFAETFRLVLLPPGTDADGKPTGTYYTENFAPPVHVSLFEDETTITIVDDDCPDTANRFVLEDGVCVDVYTGPVVVTIAAPGFEQGELLETPGGVTVFRISAQEFAAGDPAAKYLPVQIKAEALNPGDKLVVEYALIPRPASLGTASEAQDFFLGEGRVTLERRTFADAAAPTAIIAQIKLDDAYEMHESFVLALRVKADLDGDGDLDFVTDNADRVPLADPGTLPDLPNHPEIVTALLDAAEREVLLPDRAAFVIQNDDPECPADSLVCYTFDIPSGLADPAYTFTKAPELRAEYLLATPFLHRDDRRFALSFDGQDDLIQSTAVGPLPSQQITLEFWMRPTAVSSRAHPIGLGGDDGATVFLMPDGTISWRFAAIGGLNIARTFGRYRLDAWQHVAVTYDGEFVRGFVNGVLGATVKASGSIAYSNDEIVLGSFHSGGVRHFSGAIDEVRIWDRALSSSELATVMQGAIRGTEDSLALYWRLDEGTGVITTDLSGGAQHGRLPEDIERRPIWTSDTPPLSYRGVGSQPAIGLPKLAPVADPPSNESQAIAATTWLSDPEAPALLPNLLVNSAETVRGPGEVPGWEITRGAWWSRPADGPESLVGSEYFYPGAFVTIHAPFLTTQYAPARMFQTVSVEEFAERIDAGGQEFVFTGYVRTLAPTGRNLPDSARVLLVYLDADGGELGRFDSGEIISVDRWQAIEHREVVPVDTRKIRVELIGLDRLPEISNPVSGRAGRIVGPALQRADVGVLFDGLSLQAVEPSYFEFTVRPDTRALPDQLLMLTVTAIDFWDRAAPEGPTEWEVRSSLDGFDRILASGTTSPDEFEHNVRVPIPDHGCLFFEPLTFRIYGLSQANAEWQVENAALLGKVHPITDCYTPPQAGADSFEIGLGQLLIVGGPGLTENDDPGSGSSVIVNVTPVTRAAHGSLTLGDDGSFTYVPIAGFTGEDGFDYEIYNQFGASQAHVTITVLPDQPPTIDAGPDIDLTCATMNQPVTLVGSATDPEGQPLTFAWTQRSGPTVTVTPVGANGQSIQFVPIPVSRRTRLVFELTVSDGIRSVRHSVAVTIPGNSRPTANAGQDSDVSSRLLFAGLDGSASSDPDGCPLSYEWTGPVSITDLDPNDSAATFNPRGFTNGTVLTFTLIVNDGHFSSAPDEVKITVRELSTVTKGPISSAVVFLDANRNGVQDFLDFDADGARDSDEPDEPSTITEADGSFFLPLLAAFDHDGDGSYGPAEGTIVTIGGIDITTGLPLTMPLTAPAGSRVVNPLTTVVAAVVERHGLTLAAAQQVVLDRLGLPAVDLSTFDAFDEVLAGHALAPAVYATVAKVHDAATITGRLLEGASAADSFDTGMAAYAALADTIVGAAGRLDLSDAAVLLPIIHAAAAALATDVSAAEADAAATLIAASAQSVDQLIPAATPEFLRNVVQIERVAQEQTAADLAAAAEGTRSLAEVLEANTGQALSDRISTTMTGSLPTPLISIDDVQQVEGTGGIAQLAFPIHLSSPSLVPVSVDFLTFDGSARTGDGDYIFTSGTVQFGPGETEQSIRVDVLADRDVEASETLFVRLTNPLHALLGDSAAVAIIVNDDGHAPVITDQPVTTGVPGQPLTLFADVSTTFADTPRITLDWGDGTAEPGPFAVTANGLKVLGLHTYTVPGDFTIAIRLENGEGNVVDSVRQVRVQTVVVLPDPLDPARSILAAGGTSGNDTIQFAGTDRGVLVTHNGEVFGPFATVSRLVAFGQHGFDQIVAAELDVPAEFYGGFGNDTLVGGAAADVLDGGPGRDRITAGAGDDLLFGGDGNDDLDAGTGNDEVDGGPGNDAISGQDGDDALHGGDGSDRLLGQSGRDVLFGEAGDDTLDGGPGQDLLVGGTGLDETIESDQDDLLVQGDSPVTQLPVNPASIRLTSAGPAGFGAAAFIMATPALAYTIRFENPAAATVTAQMAVITEQLDPHLDFTSFEFGQFGLGGTTFEVPAGQTAYSTRLDLIDTRGVVVDVDFNFDPSSGLATWSFRSLDPTSLDLPIDPQIGFLPPNQTGLAGEGFVTYGVRPQSGLPTGTQLSATPRGLLDLDSPRVGAEVIHTIDAGPPTSRVAALPSVVTMSNFTVSWSGTDDAGGSGLAFFDVFVSDNGPPLQPLRIATTETSVAFEGQFGHTYAFFSVATDSVGHRQATPASAQATTTVVAADGPRVTSVRLVPSRNRRTVASVVLVFDKDLDAGTAQTPGNYEVAIVTVRHRSGRPDIVKTRLIPLRSATYEPNGRTVTLTPGQTVRINQQMRVTVRDSVTDPAGVALDGNADGEPGGNFVTSGGLWQRIEYTDSNGDRVTLELDRRSTEVTFSSMVGGLMEVTSMPGGMGRQIRLLNTDPRRDVLRGRVRRQERAGDGVTQLTVFGLDTVRNRLPPSFIVAAIDVQVVDALLASGELLGRTNLDQTFAVRFGQT